MGAANTLAPHLDEPKQDEDLYLPRNRTRKDHRSKLMRSYEANGGRIGGVDRVNACPFGCQAEDLDDNDYCEHMVGTTVPGDNTRFYAWRRRPEPMQEFGYTDGSKTLNVETTDKLVRITNCCRVYRRSGTPDTPAKEPKKAKE